MKANSLVADEMFPDGGGYLGFEMVTDNIIEEIVSFLIHNLNYKMLIIFSYKSLINFCSQVAQELLWSILVAI